MLSSKGQAWVHFAQRVHVYAGPAAFSIPCVNAVKIVPIAPMYLYPYVPPIL